jgi:hypothetical protein
MAIIYAAIGATEQTALEQVGSTGGGGATLPDTPANVLLDAGNASKVVTLDGSGAGTTTSFIDTFQTGAVAAIGGEAAGTALIADGAGDVATTSADVSAFLASANAAAALASIGGASDPVAVLPESASVSLFLRNADIRGADNTFAAQWPAAVGPVFYGYSPACVGSTDPVWYGGATSGFPIFQTTSGVREIRWQGNFGGSAPILPASGAGAWSLLLVVVGAQLTGTSASIAGWGNFGNTANVTVCSRLNSLTAWAVTVRGNSQTDVTQAILDSGTYPATTDPTALLVTYDGATLSFWKAVAVDSDWLLIGTLSVTLAIATTLPFSLARAGGNTAWSSTVGVREAALWTTALDATARTALRSYITTAALL